MDLNINCIPFNARLTETGCLVNQRGARQVLDRIKANGIDNLLTLGEHEINLLAGCGQCSKCKLIENGFFLELLKESFDLVIDDILEPLEKEERSNDPEIQRQKYLATQKRYNDKPEVKARRKKQRNGRSNHQS